MAELTQTEIETKIAAIDAQLDILVAAPERAVDYRMGSKNFSNSQKMDNLLRLREHFQKLLDSIPGEDYNRFAVETSDIGEDLSEYLGD